MQIGQRSKQASIRALQRYNPELCWEFWTKRAFWSRGYLCCSVGNACLETIRQYIEIQS
ncbi:MAG: transposase [Candidatus Hodarchaeales archaeon]